MQATAARAVEATAMNAVSSRSHSVFMLSVRGMHAASATLLEGALNLVDLAGRRAIFYSLFPRDLFLVVRASVLQRPVQGHARPVDLTGRRSINMAKINMGNT